MKKDMAPRKDPTKAYLKILKGDKVQEDLKSTAKT